MVIEKKTSMQDMRIKISEKKVMSGKLTNLIDRDRKRQDKEKEAEE